MKVFQTNLLLDKIIVFGSQGKARATGEITKNNGVYDQTVNVGLNLNWTIFDGFNISTTYKQLKELERQGETNTRIAIEDFICGPDLGIL